MSLSPQTSENQWRPRRQRPTRSNSLDKEDREHEVVHAGRGSRWKRDWGVTSIAPMKKRWLDARRYREHLQFKSKKSGKSGEYNLCKEPMISMSSKNRAMNTDVVLGSAACEVLKSKRDKPVLRSHSSDMAVKETCRIRASSEDQTSLSHSGTKCRQHSAFKQHRWDGSSQHQEVCNCNMESCYSHGFSLSDRSREAHEEMAGLRTQDGSAGDCCLEDDYCKGKLERDFEELSSAKALTLTGPSKTEISASLEEDSEKLEVRKSRRSFEGCCKEIALDFPGEADSCVCFVCKGGGKLLCCHGKECGRNYHLSCLVPPLIEVPPGVWLCTKCVKKKIETGVHSMSEGVDCIYGAREVEVSTSEGMMREKQYLVKYKGLAHVHNRWIPEYQLDCEAFKQRQQKEKAIRKWNSDWTVPQRFLKKRLLMPLVQADEHFVGHVGNSSNYLYEWFVKWKGLGYEHSTWELDNQPFLSSNEATILRSDYQRRREKAKNSSDPTRVAKVLEERKGSFCELSTLPGGCPSGLDFDYLRNVNKLRRYWHKCENAVIIDEKERMLGVILFILSLQPYAWRPFLIISSSAALCLWEAELMRLAPSINVVVYGGNRDARKCIWETEFYEDGGCVMIEVLLVSPDVVAEDHEVLELLGWEVIIIDECQLCNVLEHLEDIKMLTSDFKLLVFSCPPKQDSIPQYLSLLSFLGSQMDGISDDKTTSCLSDDIDLVARLKEMLAHYIAYEQKLRSSKFIEYWVPVSLSVVQLEQYCDTLLSNFYTLCSQSKTDSVGPLHDILISVQKCCDHPYLADLSLQGNLTKGCLELEYLDIGVNASSKLQLLDKVLCEIKERGLRTLILFQTIGNCRQSSIRDILDDFLNQRFGPDSYECVDSRLPNSKKQAALSMFNDKERGRFVFLLETRACLSTIKLLDVDMIIIFNSDLNPLNDVRCLQKIRIDSQFEQLKVFRFYSSCTVEERGLILAKQGVTIEGNKDYLSCSVSHMLLVWGAAALFKRLDEFNYFNRSSLDVNASDRSLLNDVVLELLAELPSTEKSSGVSNCSILLKIKHSGQAYPKNIYLVGEKEAHAGVGEAPHMFWRKLLEGKYPSWRFLPQPLQRARKKVPLCDELLDDAVVIKDDVKKKQEKAIDNIFDLVIPRKRRRTTDCWARKSKTVYISRFDGSPDGSSLPTSKKALISSGSSATQDEDRRLKDSATPDSAINDLNDGSSVPLVAQEVPHKVGLDRTTKLHDGTQCLHLPDKLEIWSLCDTMKLPEDVKDATGNLLEYVMNNHNVKAERDNIFQAFQIALCWTAASLLEYEVNHRESFELAKEHLKFECKEKDAEIVYSELQKKKKKKIFLSQMSVPRNANEYTSQNGKSNELGNGHTLSQLLHVKTAEFRESTVKSYEGEKQEIPLITPQDGQSYSSTNEVILKEVLDRTLEQSASNGEELEAGEIRESYENTNWCRGVSVEQELLPNFEKAKLRNVVYAHPSSQADEFRSGGKGNTCDETGRGTILCRLLEPEMTNLVPAALDQQTCPSGVIAESPTWISSDMQLARSSNIGEGMPTGVTPIMQSLGRNSCACDNDVMKCETVSRVVDAALGQQCEAEYSSSLALKFSRQVEQSKDTVLDLQQPNAFSEMGGEDKPTRFMSSQQNAGGTEQSNDFLIQNKEPLTPSALGNERKNACEVQNSLQQMEDAMMQPGNVSFLGIARSENSISESEPVIQKQLSRQRDVPAVCSQPPASSDNSLIQHNKLLGPNTIENEHPNGCEAQTSRQEMEVAPMQLADAASMLVEQSTVGNEHTSMCEGENPPRQIEVATKSIADSASFQIEQSRDPISASEHVVMMQLPRRTDVSVECSQPTPSAATGSVHELNILSSLQQTGMVMQQLDRAMDSQSEHSNVPCSWHDDLLLQNATRNAQAGRSEGHGFLQETEVDALLQACNMSVLVEQDVNAQLPPAVHANCLPNELEKLRRERENVIKTHQDVAGQLKSQLDREMEEVNKKYKALIDNNDVTCLEKKNALESWYDKIYLNMLLGEAFKSNFADAPKAGNSALSEGQSSMFIRQRPSGMCLRQTSWMSPSLSSPPVQVHNPADLFSCNPAAPCFRMPMGPRPNLQVAPLGSTNLGAASCYQMPMVQTPDLLATPSYRMAMTPAPNLKAAPSYRMPVGTMPNLPIGAELRAPAPHLRQTRPSIASPSHKTLQ